MVDYRDCIGNCYSFSGSDGTTREESQVQKQLSGYSSPSSNYGKDYESGAGNTNKGSTYYISPEGEKITLSWAADENGFLPKGDHLPVAPALPYTRTGAGF